MPMTYLFTRRCVHCFFCVCNVFKTWTKGKRTLAVGIMPYVYKWWKDAMWWGHCRRIYASIHIEEEHCQTELNRTDRVSSSHYCLTMIYLLSPVCLTLISHYYGTYYYLSLPHTIISLLPHCNQSHYHHIPHLLLSHYYRTLLSCYYLTITSLYYLAIISLLPHYYLTLYCLTCPQLVVLPAKLLHAAIGTQRHHRDRVIANLLLDKLVAFIPRVFCGQILMKKHTKKESRVQKEWEERTSKRENTILAVSSYQSCNLNDLHTVGSSW